MHTFDTYYHAPPVTETTCYTEYKTVSTVLCQIDQGPPLCLAHFMLNQARHSPTKNIMFCGHQNNNAQDKDFHG